MRKHFRDFVRQCEQYQVNKEHNMLPDGNTQTLYLPSEIFLSSAIEFMEPFTKLIDYNSILLVVDKLWDSAG